MRWKSSRGKRWAQFEKRGTGAERGICRNQPTVYLSLLVRPERLELPAYWFEASRSIQLSYGRTHRPLYKLSYTVQGMAASNLEIEIKLRLDSIVTTRRLLGRLGF